MTLTYYFDDDEYVFEVSDSDLQRALVKICHKYGTRPSGDDFDGDSDLYHDELIDYFERDAYEEYNDAHELAVNPDRYYGVSRRDQMEAINMLNKKVYQVNKQGGTLYIRDDNWFIILSPEYEIVDKGFEYCHYIIDGKIYNSYLTNALPKNDYEQMNLFNDELEEDY